MVPDKFNMVDMDGIDLIMAQGEEVPGLYNRLVESIAQCRYQCLYNWFFDGVVIPPSYVEMEVNEDEEVAINEGITVSPDDVIHIYSLSPGPVDPEIIPLLAEENGVYNVPAGKDGFNPVTVDVPSYTPVINSISITENGTYTAPSGVDGYSPISVDVSGGGPLVIYSNDRTLAVYVDTDNSRLVWYFMGFTKTSNDVPIPPEIFIGQPGLMYSKAYDSDKQTQLGHIGFYNDMIRSWNIATSELLAGTFWGVVYSNGGPAQTNPYSDPPTS